METFFPVNEELLVEVAIFDVSSRMSIIMKTLTTFSAELKDVEITNYDIGKDIQRKTKEKETGRGDRLALLNQGIALIEEGQYDRSIAFFNKAIEINPSYADAYRYRGVAYYYKDQYDNAIFNYTMAIKMNPRYAEAYNNRRHAYRYKGEYDKAISDYNTAIEINPRNADAHSGRGWAYGGKGQFDVACSDWKRACDMGAIKACELLKRKGLCK